MTGPTPTAINGIFKYSPYFIQVLVTSVYWPFLKFFLHYKVKGLENIKNLPTNTAIFASNHSSELDPILVTLILRKAPRFLPIFYVSREKSFYDKSSWRKIIYGGLIFKLCGAYPVYTGLHDYEKSLSNHISILEGGHSLCIFPEGKRSQDGTIKEARGGTGYLAYRTKVPVIPIAISGVYNLNFKDFILRKRNLLIKIGKPIYLDQMFEDINAVQSQVSDHNVFRDASKVIMNLTSAMLSKTSQT